MPGGCIIGLSTAFRILQNISKKRSVSSCTLYWASVLPRCVRMLVSVFRWSCVKFAKLSKINADKLSPKQNANLCCCRLALLSCTRTCLDISSFQGTLTCGGAPGVAAAIPARFCCCSSWATRRWAIIAITSGLWRSKLETKPAQDSISLFAVSWNLVIHRVSPLYLCCVSWVAWICTGKQLGLPWWNVVAKIFWSSSHLRQSLLGVLYLVVFCIERHLLLVDLSMLVHISPALILWCHTSHLWHLRMRKSWFSHHTLGPLLRSCADVFDEGLPLLIANASCACHPASTMSMSS